MENIIITLNQILSSMEALTERLEEEYEKRNLKKFNDIKAEILKLQENFSSESEKWIV